MIGKSTTGGGFKGLVAYTTQKAGAEILDQQNLFGKPEIWSAQFRNVASSRNLKSPVFHASLSLPHGERGTKEQHQTAARAYLKSMGFDVEKTQYAVIRHTDTQHDHIHILANRVQLDNKVVNDFQHKKRTHEATRAAELAAGFQVQPERVNAGKIKELRDKIDQSLQASGGNLANFEKELKARGIKLHTNISQTTGYVSGLSFEVAGRTYKGSEIGKSYSAGGLKKQGLELNTNARATSKVASNANRPRPVAHAANSSSHEVSARQTNRRQQATSEMTDSERRKWQRDNGIEL
jgi:hypothetical protein